MRVLVTRPEPAAQATAHRLVALGHQPIILPLARAVHDRAAILVALETRSGPLIATSAEVFRVLGNESKDFCHRQIFCVGQATAEAAKAAGFTNLHVAEGTGLSLASLIAAARPDVPLLYLAGEPRSPDLEAKLREAGISVAVVTSYRMEPVEHKELALPDLRPDAVLFYSRETAARFFRLPAVRNAPAHAFSGTRFLCISSRAAEAVPAQFSSRIAIAAAPDEESLLALLTQPSSQI